ncbi:MAG: hypothetical protein P4N24_21340 [Acidobacteriota bacterium]|nr:hypothetical protein [Acidobacteriota bacterium]
MAEHWNVVRNLVAHRAKKRRWVYGPILCMVLFILLWATEEGLTSLWYVPIIALIVIQYFRPTLLLWFSLLALFAAYTVGIVVQASFPADYVGLPLGLVPTAALLWAYPRRFIQVTETPGAVTEMKPGAGIRG